MNNKLLYAEPCGDIDARKAQIIDILSRGNVVVFTCHSVVKKVNTWNEDRDGDLYAFESNGLTHRICWAAKDYTITEEHVL